MITILKQGKMNFKPMIKLNHNIITDFREISFRPHLVVGLGQTPSHMFHKSNVVPSLLQVCQAISDSFL